MTINFQGLDLGTFWARSSLITCINKRLWWNLSTHVHVWRLQKSSISYIHTHVCTCRSTYKYIQCTYCIEQITTSTKQTKKQQLLHVPLKIWSYSGPRLALVSWTWPPPHPLLLLQAVQVFRYYLALHQTQHQTSRQQNWDWLEEVSSGVLELSWVFLCHLCCPVTVICWECLCS